MQHRDQWEKLLQECDDPEQLLSYVRRRVSCRLLFPKHLVPLYHLGALHLLATIGTLATYPPGSISPIILLVTWAASLASTLTLYSGLRIYARRRQLSYLTHL